MDKLTGSVNRRDFVKSGAAAVVGTALASQFPLKASAFYGVDDTIRVGLIGSGGRGTGAALQALKAASNTKLVAVADAFSDRIEESIKNMTEPEEADEATLDAISRIDVPAERRFDGFDGYKEVIALSDVVILTAPPGFRPMHFEAAVNAGKQIFMEKPVATDAPGIRRVLAAAQKAKEKQAQCCCGASASLSNCVSRMGQTHSRGCHRRHHSRSGILEWRRRLGSHTERVRGEGWSTTNRNGVSNA